MRPWIWVFAVVIALSRSSFAGDGNRLTYLDEFLDPYYVHRDFPKFATPQWIGEDGVECVVVLAIDDMRESARYENFLRPILDRLKAVDGRAALSIMTNRADPADTQLAKWLKEGLSIEVHTYDHPCPCLQGGDFNAARQTYDTCVDLMASIPGNRPVAFRMPCCDSLNTPSPRFWAEIFNQTTSKGNFLSIDSSVFQVFTPDDPELPREWVLREDGKERFRYYIPFPSFANTIENYPYPYIIGKLCWQFPCVVPSDWEAQHVQQPNNPDTVRDMQIALDATVQKKGVFNLVFHPHGWIRAEQVVRLIDYAVEKHGKKVKFLNFREAQDRINQFALGGQSVRDEKGNDNGVRLLDLNQDGFLDVVIGNDNIRQTRIWDPKEGRWQTSDFPTQLVQFKDGHHFDLGARFGIDASDHVFLIQSNVSSSFHFDGKDWIADEIPVAAAENRTLTTTIADETRSKDQGLRLRDLDGDGSCELLVANPEQHLVFRRGESGWEPANFQIPDDVSFVDSEGRDAGLRIRDLDKDGLEDLIFSNAQHYAVHLMRFREDGTRAGWTVAAQQAKRGEGDAVPMIVRNGTNNGAWFHSGHLWVQNEDTNRLPDHVDRRTYAALLGEQADMPRPRTPEQSLNSMHVRPGMKIELVASEPLIMDPVAFDWGPDGRLWVVEMGDYPLGVGADGADGGNVKVLTDTDRDGRYDKADTFLDHLGYPNGIKVWRKGVLITCAPEIFYAEDTDGDNRADVREPLFSGFIEGNQQHRANGMRWGVDNWLYVANGDSGGVIVSKKTGEAVAIGGRDLRIDPDSGRLQAATGQTQYGRERDDWNNWFGGNNSNPLWHYVIPDYYLRRNPHWAPPDMRHDVPEFPGASPVYPTSRTLARFNDFNMSNRFTSACSPTVYRDKLFGEEFTNNVFICEPVHNLVHREILEPDGITFRSKRAADEQKSEFLSSEDNWFRPVMARTGPDGALWICDMYRMVIEHPEWIPQSWQQRLDLRAGEDRGRIYRVYPTDAQLRRLPRMDRMDTTELVSQLDSENGWTRDMAQQMLLWRSNPRTTALIKELYAASNNPQGRLQALCTLDGLKALDEKTLRAALGDSHPQVRRHAVRLAAQQLPENLDLLAALLPLAKDPDKTVVFELLCVLGDAPAPTPIGKIIAANRDDPYMQAAFISSLRPENLTQALDDLLSADAGADTPPPKELIKPIIEFAAATKDAAAIATLVDRIIAWPSDAASDRHALSRKGTAPQRIWRLELLADIVSSLAPESRQSLPAELQAPIHGTADLARSTLEDPDAPIEERLAAVSLLAAANWQKEEVLNDLEQLLSAQQPVEIQLAAVTGLAGYADKEVAQKLLANWRSHSPALRASILDALLTRTTWTSTLLDSIEAGVVTASQLDAARQQQLLQYRAPDLRERAEKLLAVTEATDRQEVLRQFAAAKQLEKNEVHGKVLFEKHCAVCHKLQNVGHSVGADLSALSDRSFESLSVAILDPNKAVEDKYLEYIVVLQDGRQQRGMLASESTNSITLVGQEAKEFAVLRSEIDSITATGKSLMPDGLEKDISVQDFADLVAFLQKLEGEPKSFPGNEPSLPEIRDDGSIRLLATNCRIYGPTVVYEDLYRNLGFWSSTDDRAVWDVDVPKEATYKVIIDYACDDASAGNRCVVNAADQSLSAVVEGTAGWDNYRRMTVGEIKLPKGPVRLTVRSDGAINEYLFDLRGIVLDPMD